ncbi:MAG: DUF1788 domain-containing protein [Nitrospirota bacterium]|nr:DUF1788 domain-containing protein [Nitrospirota bacterium]
MGRIEKLVESYKSYISLPWQKDLAGAQKAVFVVYDKTDERRLRSRRELFALATEESGHPWKECDLTPAFPEWMGATEYQEEYFNYPEDLGLKLEEEFREHVAERVRRQLTADDADEQTVVAVFGLASLLGFAHVSDLMKDVENDIRGRIVVFFPGDYENNNYRLLDARDGWNYLAVPITAHDGVHAP